MSTPSPRYRSGETVEHIWDGANGYAVVRGGWIVVPDLAPVRADLTANHANPLERLDGRITAVGDLAEASARDTLRVEGLCLHPLPEVLCCEGGRPSFSTGSPASFVVRRGAARTSAAVWIVKKGRVRKPEDRSPRSP